MTRYSNCMDATCPITITADTPREQLPTDVATLQEMILQLLADVNAKVRSIFDLQQQLERLRRHMFGRRSEKFNPAQMALFDQLAQELTSQAAAAAPAETPVATTTEPSATAATPSRKTRGAHGRALLPEHLPHERIEYHPPQAQQQCSACGQAKQVIGEEVTQELDYVTASIVVRDHARIKYACRQCEAEVSIGEAPARPIDKGLPGPGLLAQVLTSKYADHLPLNRQEGVFARQGVDISRSTMCGWVRDSAALLNPIVIELKREVLNSKKIHTDDTTVPVQDESRTQTRRAYLWVYIGDQGDVVFDFTPTRSRDGPLKFLGKYEGYLQADAYKGYDEVFRACAVIEVACWAHARRYFYDARTSDAARAHQMLALIGRLYDVERQAKEQALDADGIRQLRQERSQPILDEIGRCLEQWSVQVLPKSPLGEAVTYARGQWQALTRYVADGDLDIDNNAAERALRMVAIGRKNWLFAGSDAGGERAAIIYSLVASCKLAGIDPFAYLRDVLDRISTHPASRIAELTPRGWKAFRTATTPASTPAEPHF